MFNLIITIISIALIAAISLATLYFGGDAFNQGSARAAAATVVNQASQISGANALYFNDTLAYGSVQDLIDNNYLSGAPHPGGNVSGADVFAVALADDAATGAVAGNVTIGIEQASVCEAINVQAGIDTPGTDTITDRSDIPGQFGCFTDGSGESAVHTFLYR